jgi:hypothetical protein
LHTEKEQEKEKCVHYKNDHAEKQEVVKLKRKANILNPVWSISKREREEREAL